MTHQQDDVFFTIKPWHEDDHDVSEDFMLHARIIIEKMPMEMWSLNGAARVLGDKCIIDRLDTRTREHGHTKTFACWMWVWDVAFIPTTHIIWRTAQDVGRVEVVPGFSPPSREVGPPPRVWCHDMLIHVDRVEDWSPLSSRSSHSTQSGLPSSGVRRWAIGPAGSKDSQNVPRERSMEMDSSTSHEKTDSDPGTPRSHDMLKAATRSRKKLNLVEEDADFIPEESIPH
ncbi:D-3-phosphoglycerate dehydrogenase, chloroplastic [Hordeum vulgare]|nr:D-3-phosphoglycerate dehydrogenase, chloroplastic [Hordeum vulgare]